MASVTALLHAEAQEPDSKIHLTQLAGHYMTKKSLLAVQDLHAAGLQGTAFLSESSTSSNNNIIIKTLSSMS